MPPFTSTKIILAVPIVLLTIAHAKSLPLGYTFRSWLWLRAMVKRAKQDNNNPLPLFQVLSQDHKCLLDDMDYNQHMNNSSYNKMLDFSRIQVLYSIFTRVMMEPNHNIYGHNGGVLTLFKKEIPPFQKYKVESRIFTWNEKWLIIEHRFVFDNEKGELVTACRALSKIVFKKGSGKTVSPSQVLEICGHDLSNPETERRREKHWELAKHLLSLDTLFKSDYPWDSKL